MQTRAWAILLLAATIVGSNYCQAQGQISAIQLDALGAQHNSRVMAWYGCLVGWQFKPSTTIEVSSLGFCTYSDDWAGAGRRRQTLAHHHGSLWRPRHPPARRDFPQTLRPERRANLFHPPRAAGRIHN